MKLFYYKDSTGNFGDDLNPYIWYSLYPELFTNDDGNELFVGIGTLINSKAPLNLKKYTFGSGVGYHSFLNKRDEWEFIFVRGPLSADALGIDKDRSITDAAILLHKMISNNTHLQREKKIVFMPHHQSQHYADWSNICNALNIDYISPENDIHDTIFRISNAKFVIADAMHAAIVADALRVPWVPVKCYDHILDFKWRDWCHSLALDYIPITLPRLWDLRGKVSDFQRFKDSSKRFLMSMNIRSGNWTPPHPKENYSTHLQLVINSLENIIINPPLFLSRDDIFNERLQQIEQAMCSFIKSRGL